MKVSWRNIIDVITPASCIDRVLPKGDSQQMPLNAKEVVIVTIAMGAELGSEKGRSLVKPIAAKFRHLRVWDSHLFGIGQMRVYEEVVAGLLQAGAVAR